jgi:hypothetical protein
MAHVALGKRFKVRSRLPSDVGNFLGEHWISKTKRCGTLAVALNPKSLPGTLPYQNFEISL